MHLKSLGGAAAILAITFAGVSGSAVSAQDDAIVSASEAVPDIIPTSAFASQSLLQGAKISHDGSKFAFSMQQDGSSYLVVYDSDTRRFLDGRNIGDEFDLNWFRWAGNDRLLFSLTSMVGREERQHRRLFVFDMASQTSHPLALSRMAPTSDRIVFTDPAGEYVLVQIAAGMWDTPDVWRFDLGGEGPPEGVKVQDAVEYVQNWFADETGVIRVGLGTTRDANVVFRYRPDADSDWKRSDKTRFDGDGYEDWGFIGIRAGSDTAYTAYVPEGSDRSVLAEFNLMTGEPGRIIHQAEAGDIGAVTTDIDNTLLAVDYRGDEYTRVWLDPEMARQKQRLETALQGKWVRILDTSDDRSRMLVRESYANDPGALYVFTPGEKRLDLFADFRPQILPSMLPEPERLEYTARDGTVIRGFLTLPKGRDPRGLPLVVLPHGGPYGIFDGNYYNDKVQLLANRGYAVVQPNYRGSGGYGEAFEKLGDGQIGRAMQDDLDDAVAHLVEQGMVDPDRVCIVGASYGGYAAVWGAIRNPEIYRCAASWAGVMHFERQLQHDRFYMWGRHRGEWSGRVGGDQTNFDLDDVSPAVHAERLQRPVLLAHGEKDTRVPFVQYTLMMHRAKGAAVPPETLVLPESGHGFSSEEDELAWYDALVDFLARHNPPD